MKLPELEAEEVEYPESDGEPMAETDRHRQLMVDLIAAAKYHYRDASDVYISGNLFLYFVKGQPSACVAPDFFLVRGVPGGERRIYKLWEEGKAPAVTIELTSKKTRREDLDTKRGIYERLGVREYFLFDPYAEYLDPALRGFRLAGGALRAVMPRESPDGTLVLESDELGLELHARGDSLRLVDPATGEPIPVLEDFARKVEESLAQLEAERRRAEESETQARRAEERAKKAEERARKAEARARNAGEGARSERSRAAAAEAELARLRKAIDRLRGRTGD